MQLMHTASPNHRQMATNHYRSVVFELYKLRAASQVGAK